MFACHIGRSHGQRVFQFVLANNGPKFESLIADPPTKLDTARCLVKPRNSHIAILFLIKKQLKILIKVSWLGRLPTNPWETNAVHAVNPALANSMEPFAFLPKLLRE